MNMSNLAMNEQASSDRYLMLANAILCEEEPICFHRTFLSFNGNADRTRIIVRCANQFIEEGGLRKYTTEALMIYPAVKWLIRAEKIEDVIDSFDAEEIPDGNAYELKRLLGVQQILSDALGGKPELRLEMRKRFFSRCKKLVDTVDRAVEIAVYHNTPRAQRGRIQLTMALLTGNVNQEDPLTTHIIRTHFESIVDDVAAAAGEEIKSLMKALAPEEKPHSDELAYLYHNIDVLLREYSRILYTTKNSCDETLRMLARDEEDLLVYNSSGKRCEQAYYVVEYVKLIRGAVEMIRDFPGESKLFDVLVALISEKHTKKRSDEELAVELLMAPASFSVFKHRALSVLGAVLWGCDVSLLLELLQ